MKRFKNLFFFNIINSPIKFLAILCFNQNYKRLPNLDGVAIDKSELTEVLKNYKKEFIDNSDDVLKSLKDSVEYYNEEKKKFERVHFHFSGKIF